MAYPIGVIGVILVMGGLRRALRVDPHRVAEDLEALKEKEASRLAGINLEVRNAELSGLTVSQVVDKIGGGVVISRLSRGVRAQEVPRAKTKVWVGDRIHAVGAPEMLERLRSLVGVEIAVDLTGGARSEVTSRRIVVTRRGITGKTVEEMNLRETYGLIVTRIIRTGLEFTPRADFRLQFGDELRVVGKPEAIDAFAKDAGESGERLSQAAVVPMFIGIALGVALGSLPIKLPGSARDLPDRFGRRPPHRGRPPEPDRLDRPARLARPAERQHDAPDDRHLALPGRGGASGRGRIRRHAAQGGRLLDPRRGADHAGSRPDDRGRGAALLQGQFPVALRPDRREHDQSAGPGLREFPGAEVGRDLDVLRDRLPADHAAQAVRRPGIGALLHTDPRKSLINILKNSLTNILLCITLYLVITWKTKSRS